MALAKVICIHLIKGKSSLCLLTQNDYSLDSVKNITGIYYVGSTIYFINKNGDKLKLPHHTLSSKKLSIQIHVISETGCIVSSLFRVCHHTDRSGSICNIKVFFQEINSPRGANLCVESFVTLYERKPRKRHFKMKNRLNTLSLGQVVYFIFIFWPHSVQFSHSVVSESLQPHGLQHTKLPFPPTSGACSNS